MDWLSFVSSAFWPVAAVFALLLFRGDLKTWVKTLPKRLKAGPVEVEWDQAVGKAVEAIEDARMREIPTETSPEEPPAETNAEVDLRRSIPVEPLTLMLRDLANTMPDEAVVSAWRQLEMQLRRVGREWGMSDGSGRSITPRQIVKVALDTNALPEWFGETFQAMQKLRDIAVHVGGITSRQAYEFLALSDLLLGELRRLEHP
ncbi:hypothetical protein AB0L57_32215 [Nocardia sp. NPDC052254]|uniref:hypothetical protein n=1 Tax=Nocardia sp. NPDC052254 TaxID=3155681 RepID=UPI00343E6AF1